MFLTFNVETKNKFKTQHLTVQNSYKMNSVEKELHGYINGTEAMSGFDSYDSYEGEYGYFDDADTDFDYIDGDSFDYASGANPATTGSYPRNHQPWLSFRGRAGQ